MFKRHKQAQGVVDYFFLPSSEVIVEYHLGLGKLCSMLFSNSSTFLPYLEDICTNSKVSKKYLHPKFETVITHACIYNKTPK